VLYQRTATYGVKARAIFGADSLYRLLRATLSVFGDQNCSARGDEHSV